jgi:hypothetical protein
MSTKPTDIALRRALDLMHRTGTRLVLMHTNTRSGNGVAYFIVPGGAVDRETAEKIKKHPAVTASGDALFPNMSQTWRLRTSASG